MFIILCVAYEAYYCIITLQFTDRTCNFGLSGMAISGNVQMLSGLFYDSSLENMDKIQLILLRVSV